MVFKIHSGNPQIPNVANIESHSANSIRSEGKMKYVESFNLPTSENYALILSFVFFSFKFAIGLKG